MGEFDLRDYKVYLEVGTGAKGYVDGGKDNGEVGSLESH